MNSVLTSEKLQQHLAHDVAVVKYGVQNISLECNDCYEVLADTDEL